MSDKTEQKTQNEDDDDLDFCTKESPYEKRLRMISTLSYVIVLIAFGVPIWWHTTKVYRAPLPLDDMLLMGQMAPPPLSVLIHASTHTRSNLLCEETQSLLGETVNVTIHSDKINLPISNDEKSIEIAAKQMKVSDGQLLLVEWPLATVSIILTSQRVVYFKSDVSGYRLAMFLENWPGVELKNALADPNVNDVKNKIMRPFSAAPKFDILVTLLNPEPENLNIEWDVKGAIQDYLQPFFDLISDVSDFTIKSQWLYLVDLGVKPRNVGDHFALSELLLPHIISPLEKKLSSYVSKDPCINLVVYVPSCKNSPIHIYSLQGVRTKAPIDAFISPKWGGFLIANPSCPNTTFDLNEKNELLMSTFITHLHQLLGLPDLKSVILDEVTQTGYVPALWQKDYLMRSHTIEYLDAARLSLRSLSQLLLEISNIVINDDIAATVKESIDNINMADDLLDIGEVVKAFACAKRAQILAEKAFTDPSLLALLYFPDDQKYAVYIPLFLPVMIPVIISIGPLIKYLSTPENEKRNLVLGAALVIAFLAYFIPFTQIFKILEDQKLL